MDVDLLFKIAAIGIIVAVLHQVLVRAGREDQAMMTTLTGLIIVLAIVVTQISNLFNTVKALFDLWNTRKEWKNNGNSSSHRNSIYIYIFNSHIQAI